VHKLVVVGDQSAGKSSVLQAITEVPIQISFRQSSAATEFPVKATIVPGGQSENDEALLARIRDFSVERVELTTDVIKEIMDQVCLGPWMVGYNLIARSSRQPNVFLARINRGKG
jgi:GTPase SAR1 family protein